MNLHELNLDEKIAQMIIVGFRGLVLEDEGWLSDFLSQGRLGGVILFEKDFQTAKERNIANRTQLVNLINQIKNISRYFPFIAIDQEGGSVSRLNSSNGFEDFPSAEMIAEKGDISYAKTIYSELARNLSLVGCNVNFAPVVDLCLNPDNGVIVKKKRCYSSDPEVVVSFAEIFIQSLLEKNVLPVAKHFPGHGSALGDTHTSWVDVTYFWKSIELKPYEILNTKGLLDAVMVGHLFNKNIDPLYPASLSHIWIEEVLRKQIGFKGLVFTDDLQMRAIADNFSFEEVVEIGLNAGVDVFVFANQIEYEEQLPLEFIKIAKKLIQTRKISEERIDKSVERIIYYKNKFMLN
ncbi:MAG: glycoside hydrolase family 3 N-terminal domain-containing protein [Candidatus Kapaibacteriota bacterium]|jgi:beta-N-acetylhexosaminidase